MATVRNGQHIVVKRARDTKLLYVKSGTTGGIGKVKFDFTDIIGRQFGIPYEVKQKKLHPCSTLDASAVDEEEMETGDLPNNESPPEVEDTSKMDESDQSTCHEHIEKMRKAGASGQEIITKLAMDNPSFRHKNVYAKEKYLKKKEKKYSAIITIYPPSIRMIHEIYYLKDADKISYLRQDCLAHLLTWSNVHHGCRVAIVEQCLGVVTASVLERMAGGGRCIRLHKGNALQSVPCLAAMDLEEELLKALLPVPLDDFWALDGEQNNAVVTKTVNDQESEELTNEDDARLARREDRESRKAAGLQVLKEADLDSFIIAGKEHPLVMMQKLIKYTRPSRPFVIYCTYVQPLLECYQWLREENKALNIQLMDMFYRKHQVLPGRSHPEMNQPIAAGYILTGTTITG